MSEMTAIDQQMARVRAAAETYLEFGWSIIPIRPDTKNPAITWTEFQERQPTEEEVAEWFDRGVPDGCGGFTTFFGLGIITGAVSNLVVLDCDNTEALTYALSQLGLWSPLGVTTTRGQHLYFRHPGGGARVQNRVGGNTVRDWPQIAGLDLRGDGGFVVAPPSIKFGKDGVAIHEYSFTVSSSELTDAVLSLPTWRAVEEVKASSSPIASSDSFSIEDLALDSVRTYGESVWDDASKRVKALGRKMKDGDGRNAWITRYIGECISSGMGQQQAEVAAETFSAEFFSDPLPARELDTTIRSVISVDKRNHPEKYEPTKAEAPSQGRSREKNPELRLITPSSLSALRSTAGGSQFLIDPFLPAQSIVQVAGFNGHGKSLLLLNMLWAASLGQDFGPAVVNAPIKALYLDHESSGATLSQRIDECESLLGPMKHTMAIWSSSLSNISLDFAQPDSLGNLSNLLKEVKPQVVVIDTVRSAWHGMEENSPHSWMRVNNLAIALRNAGMTVVLVHHRNKPGQNGLGREAGSTAQLKDLDTQIFVTKVVEDDDQARREAALPDSATQVVDQRGGTHTAFAYLRRSLPQGFGLRAVFEVTFGKVRQASENNVPTFVGIASNNKTGRRVVVSSKTPRQKAVIMKRSGKEVGEIAESLSVPEPTINRWIEQEQSRHPAHSAQEDLIPAAATSPEA